MTSVRTMSERDIGAVLRIQAECYVPHMVEADETIRLRLREFSDTAWVAEDARGICGYLVAYGSRMGKITPLGAMFARFDDADTFYLHDLAVAGRSKGQGVAQTLTRHALEYAAMHGYRFSALVSVQGSQAFWRRLGYEAWEAVLPDQRNNLQTYASHACYMVRQLAATP